MWAALGCVCVGQQGAFCITITPASLLPSPPLPLFFSLLSASLFPPSLLTSLISRPLSHPFALSLPLFIPTPFLHLESARYVTVVGWPATMDTPTQQHDNTPHNPTPRALWAGQLAPQPAWQLMRPESLHGVLGSCSRSCAAAYPYWYTGALVASATSVQPDGIRS